MAVICRPLDASGAAAWDAFVDSHPDATFFHKSAWADVLTRAFGHTSHYLMATQDGAVTGILPLARVRSMLFGHTLISTPFCVYGGPLAVDRESFDALLRAATEALEQTGASALELRLRESLPEDQLDPAEWPARDDLYVTFRKPITANDDANLKAIPRKQRAMVRKGIDGSLSTTVSQDTDVLHRVYAESVRNLGTPVFPRRYFRLLADTFRDSMDVLAVGNDGTVTAAVMNFYWRDEVLPYYGGGTHAARACYANDFMYWEVMRHAAAKGARLFDFGRSKAGTGAYSFKKNWGFTPAPLSQRFRLRPGEKMPDNNPLNPKYRLFIAGWKKLPLPVANLVGPYIVRGVG
jgi:FemAB-related protein (PEP-CTERM system-associated)